MSDEQLLPLSQLPLNDYNARIRTKDRSLKDLRASIERLGVLVPIIAVYDPKGKVYHVPDGNRRVAAAKSLGLKTIPALVHKPKKGQTCQELIDQYWQEHNMTVRPVPNRERVETAIRGGPVYNSATASTLYYANLWHTHEEQLDFVNRGFTYAPETVKLTRAAVCEYFQFTSQRGSNPESYDDPAARELARILFRWMTENGLKAAVQRFLRERAVTPSTRPIDQLIKCALLNVPGVPFVTHEFRTPRLPANIVMPKLKRKL